MIQTYIDIYIMYNIHIYILRKREALKWALEALQQ